MSHPLICVRMPSRNHAAFAAEAIASVCTQNWPNLHVVVCDDASTDDTLRVLKTLQDHFKFTLLSNEKQLGLIGTLNRITEYCPDADFYFNFATDDILEPGALRLLAESLIAHPEAAASVGGFRLLESSTGKLQESSWPLAPEGWVNPAGWAKHTAYIPQAWLMTRGESIRRIGAYPPDIGFEDLYLILWLFTRGERIYKVAPNLVRYRRHATNVSGTSVFMNRGTLCTCAYFIGFDVTRLFLRHNYQHPIRSKKRLIRWSAILAMLLPPIAPYISRWFRRLAAQL